MKRYNFLYSITTATALTSIVIAGYFLIRSGLPSADVLAKYEENHPLIKISDFELGDALTIKLNQLPVIVWRRNANDIALAKHQDVPAKWPYSFSVVSGEIEPQPAYDANLSVNHEWFFAWAKNPSGFGCYELTRTGDFDGFYDPCRGDHFDLSGRFRKGIAVENLRVISAQMTEDGEYFKLDLTNPP